MRVLLASVAVLLCPGVAEGALILRYEDGSPAPALQAWVDASDAPVPGGTVTIHRAGCYDTTAPACTTEPGVAIWLGPGVPSGDLRATLSHELGHRFDYRVMTPQSRAIFKRLISDPRPWRAAPNSPHEKFAEAYGLCFRHRAIRAMRLRGYKYFTHPPRHRRVCRLIRRTAAGRYAAGR